MLTIRRLFQIAPVSTRFMCTQTRDGQKTRLNDFRDFLKDSAQNPPKIDISGEHVPYLNAKSLSGNNRKVFFETYGCQMNSNDTEIARAILFEAGYSECKDMDSADIVLLVTCAIREGAEQKIWKRIEHLKLQKIFRNKNKPSLNNFTIGILGCMAERLKQTILEKEPAIDLIAGPDSYRNLPQMLATAETGQTAVNVLLSLDETYANITPVRVDPNSISAYISIMRGCDNMCTYCIVPFTRGRERSRPIDSILHEVRILSDQGIKEITLLGQNVNSYHDKSETQHYFVDGSSSTEDRPTNHVVPGFSTVYKPKIGGRRFADLLDKVSLINPEIRIRFTSPHPKDFPDSVLHLIKERSNICNNLHMPAQSGNNRVLEAMGRGYTRESYLNLIQHAKAIIPDATFTSDFIAGFCGETEEAHEDTLSLMRAVKYHFCYVFAYSLREKTRAHRRLADDVPLEVKKRRLSELHTSFRELAHQANKSFIGSTHLVLVEKDSKRSADCWVGRNDYNIKTIFQKVALPFYDYSTVDTSDSDTRIPQPGEYVAVKIEDCSSEVLKAKPLYRTTLNAYHANQHLQIVDERQEQCSRANV